MKKRRSPTQILLVIMISLIIVTTVLLAFSSDGIKKFFEQLEFKREYVEYVESAAYEFDVDANLIYAVIKAESDFDASSTSESGAVGLMQLLPETYLMDICKIIGTEESADALYDPKTNIRAGTYYLSYLINYFGSVRSALAAYNAGMGNVASWLEKDDLCDENGELIPEKIPYYETRVYVSRTEYNFKQYSSLYPNVISTDEQYTSGTSDTTASETASPTEAVTAETTASAIDITDSTITTATGDTSSTDNTEITEQPEDFYEKPLFLTEAEVFALAQKYGAVYDIDPCLILAIAKIESSFNAHAYSRTNDYGLMQINPPTYLGDIRPATGTGEDIMVLLDAETNVMCGTYYLRWLSDRISGTEEIIVAYNYGIGNVLRMLADENYSYGGKLIYDNIPSASARSYLRRVMTSYEDYKLIYGGE